VAEADGDLERACTDADLCPDGHVARARAIVNVGQVTVAITEIDLQVRASVVAGGRATEGTYDADPADA
jgi:hypothetical protein